MIKSNDLKIIIFGRYIFTENLVNTIKKIIYH